MKSSWILIFLTLALTGCKLAQSFGDKSTDSLVLTDASHRALTLMSVATDGDGRRVKPSRVLCAEPSPDIAKAVSSAVESSLKLKGEGKGASGEVAASLDRTFTESIVQLGSRLATIQLLRDELSDLCRAYANGAVSSITYTLRLSRLDKKMITLLVSEASAGALSRALVSVNGLASTGGHPSPEALANAEKRISEEAKAAAEAAKVLTDANVKLDAATGDSLIEARKVVSKAEENLKNRLNELSDRVLEKWAFETRGTGLLAGSSTSAIAGIPNQPVSALDLRSIHRAYLDDDDLGTLLDACLTSMEDNAVLSHDISAASERVRENLLKAKTELVLAEERYNNFLIDKPQNKTQNEMRQDDARQMGKSSSREWPLPIETVDDAKRNLRVAKAMVDQLTREYENKSGLTERTQLLTYCRRGGMENVVRLIEQKIKNRYSIEVNRSNAEVCQKALESASIPQETKANCVSKLIEEATKQAPLVPPLGPPLPPPKELTPF